LTVASAVNSGAFAEVNTVINHWVGVVAVNGMSLRQTTLLHANTKIVSRIHHSTKSVVR